MKRNIQLLTGLFFSLFLTGTLEALERPLQFVEAGSGYVTAKNIEREFNPFNISYCVKSKPADDFQKIWTYDALFGMQFSKDVFDFTVSGSYFLPYTSWQFENSRLDLGGNLLYHFQRYYDLYTEHDFYFESVFRFAAGNKLVFLSNLGSGFKAADIDALKCGPLWDFSFSSSVFLNYFFNNGAEAYGGISSHELYRFPLFYTPVNYLGFAWNFKNGIRLSTDIGIRFRDWFIVAPYIDRYEWNVKVRYSF